jgi:drug/metabolite transporter (DMT)-like permease
LNQYDAWLARRDLILFDQKAMTNSKNIILLFIPGTLWGVSFLLVEIILETVPPFTLTAGRNVISTVALLLILYGRGGRLPKSWQGWQPYLIVGIFSNALPFVIISWGQQYIDSGLASILVSTMPLFTLLLAHFFSVDERLTSLKLAGISLGLMGVVVLIGPGVWQSLGRQVWGQLAVVGGSLSYALSAIYSRRYFQRTRLQADPRRMAALKITTGQFVSSTFLLVPLSFILEKPLLLQPSNASLVALLAQALPITLIPVVVYYYLIDQVGASYASITVYLIPINGVLWGALLLAEPITWHVVLAMSLILAGIAIVNQGTGRGGDFDTGEEPLPPPLAPYAD